MSAALLVLSLLGFLVSLYAYIVERKAYHQKDYRALCDFTQSMSCTKAFTSPYGKLLGVSNALGGLVFYPLLFLLTWFSLFPFVFLLSLLAFLGSLYLAYLSYVKMRNFCVVCTMVYVINLLLFLFAASVFLSI